MNSRQQFEAWYESQPDGNISPWDVWKASRKAISVTDEELHALGKMAFEDVNGRPHPWEGLQGWVIKFARAAIAKATPGAPDGN